MAHLVPSFDQIRAQHVYVVLQTSDVRMKEVAYHPVEASVLVRTGDTVTAYAMDRASPASMIIDSVHTFYPPQSQTDSDAMEHAARRR